MATDALSVIDSIAITEESHGLTGVVREFEVVNLDGAGWVTFRFDGTAAVDGAEGAYALAKIAGDRMTFAGSWSTGVTVSFIANTSATVVMLRKIA